MSNIKKIGKNIRKVRKEQSATLLNVATSIKKTPTQIHYYESGEDRVSSDVLFEIAKALHTDVSEFFNGCK